MAVNRFVLNGISYHGHGAIKEIPGLIKARGFKKAFVASDPDLVKFGVTANVTNLLEENDIPYTLYSDIKPNPTIENIQHGVEAYRIDRCAQGRLHVVLRLKPRHERFLEPEEAQPHRIYGDGSRNARHSRRIERAAAIDDGCHVRRQHTKPDGGGHHHKQHLAR